MSVRTSGSWNGFHHSMIPAHLLLPMLDSFPMTIASMMSFEPPPSVAYCPPGRSARRTERIEWCESEAMIQS